MINSIVQVIEGYNKFFLIYVGAINSMYFLLLILAFVNLNVTLRRVRYADYMRMLSSSQTPPISVRVPCYNEEETIVENIHSLINLEYGDFEIIIINDGSRDNTLKNIIEAFGLVRVEAVYQKLLETKSIMGIYYSPVFRNIVVVDKENGGKADALNAGINMAKNQLFVAIDADSVMERNSLIRIVQPFIDHYDETAAAGGIVMIENGCTVSRGFIEKAGLSKNILARFQTIEYLRAFLSGRMGWSLINGLLIVSGAFGIFKKDVVISVGGYTPNTIGEDMELVIKIHKYMKRKRKKYRLVFIPDPVCWTQCPEDIKSLYSQRKRWQRGLFIMD